MKRLNLLMLLGGLTVGWSCSESTNFVPKSELVVVEAYLYAGELISDVRVAGTLGLGSVDTLAPPINDAQVNLIKNGICYVLQPWNQKGYYRYTERVYTPYDCNSPDCLGDNELTVGAGDRFRLEILYFDKVASAETVVPEKPRNLELSANNATVQIPAASYTGDWQTQPGGLFADDLEIAVTVSWEDDGQSWYYVTLENTDFNPVLIDPASPFTYPGKFVSNPFTGDHFPIGQKNFTHYGRHRVKVFRLNQDYVRLYLTRNQDTRDLNEPLTNIENGLGIFTAFNSDRLEFYVIP